MAEYSSSSFSKPIDVRFSPHDDLTSSLSPQNHFLKPARRSGTAIKRGKRMDPFEVRVRFTQLLANLNASVTSATKTAQYAIKYRDMDEDLHSCIIEQLERSQNSMNNRANIMYFLEHLCEMANRENHIDYIRMMQRDILRIVDAVAPEDGSGAANVKVVRKVLQALQAKSFLLAQTVSEIEEILKERDTASANITSSPISAHASNGTPKPIRTQGVPQRLDKKQVEQRIEEDRERHKRQREGAWAIPKVANLSMRGASSGYDALAATSEAEFEKLWDETSDLGEDDWILYQEEFDDRETCAEDWKENFRSKHSE